MELGGEEGLGLVADALVGAVVHVDEVRLPLGGQGALVDGETVVLGGDVAAVGAAWRTGWLWLRWPYFSLKVLAPAARPSSWLPMQMPKMGFSRFIASRMCSTVTEQRAGLPGPLEMKQPVPFQLVEIVVPGDADHFDPAGDEVAEDLVLHAAIDQDDLLVAVAVADDLLAADFGNLVLQVGIGDVEGRLPAASPPGRSCPSIAPSSRRIWVSSAGVDAADAGDLLLIHPGAQALDGVPVAVFLTVVGDDQAADVDFLGFEALEQMPSASGFHRRGCRSCPGSDSSRRGSGPKRRDPSGSPCSRPWPWRRPPLRRTGRRSRSPSLPLCVRSAGRVSLFCVLPYIVFVIYFHAEAASISAAILSLHRLPRLPRCVCPRSEALSVAGSPPA